MRNAVEAIRPMRWHLLWFLPILTPLFLILAAIDAFVAYRNARVVLTYWRWPFVISPAFYVWALANLATVRFPIQALITIPGFYAVERSEPVRNTATAIALALVGVFVAWLIAWGAFPLSADGAHLRMVPFIPWPDYALF